jgi:pimeloyl-ACP methyl ester carboxylesterase
MLDIVNDIKADADIRLVDSGKKGKVHKGFSDALDEVWQDLHVYVKGLQNEGRTVWITGHSLGAALATLAAYRYEDVQGLYTFGSPRVGNEDFVKDFHVTAYRFENNNDIVCKVPPPLPGLYAHIGKLKYIDNKGRIHDDISLWKRWKDAVEGRFKKSMSALHLGFQGLVPDAIKDHVPVLYAIHIWNSLAA